MRKPARQRAVPTKADLLHSFRPKDMAYRLKFDTTDESHRRHYELAHVIMLTTRVALSPAELNRLGDLQDEWESRGEKHEDELVVNDRDFSVARHTLPEDDTVVDVVLEDTVHDLLLKIAKETALSGHVARPKRALVAFVEAAEKGKLTSDGFVPAAAKPAATVTDE